MSRHNRRSRAPSEPLTSAPDGEPLSYLVVRGIEMPDGRKWAQGDTVTEADVDPFLQWFLDRGAIVLPRPGPVPWADGDGEGADDLADLLDLDSEAEEVTDGPAVE